MFQCRCRCQWLPQDCSSLLPERCNPRFRLHHKVRFGWSLCSNQLHSQCTDPRCHRCRRHRRPLHSCHHKRLGHLARFRRTRPRRHRCRRHRRLLHSCHHKRPRRRAGCHHNRSPLLGCQRIHIHRWHQGRCRHRNHRTRQHIRPRRHRCRRHRHRQRSPRHKCPRHRVCCLRSHRHLLGCQNIHTRRCRQGHCKCHRHQSIRRTRPRCHRCRRRRCRQRSRHRIRPRRRAGCHHNRSPLLECHCRHIRCSNQKHRHRQRAPRHRRHWRPPLHQTPDSSVVPKSHQLLTLA